MIVNSAGLTLGYLCGVGVFCTVVGSEMLLLAETDTNTMTLGIVTSVMGFLSLVFTGYIGYRMAVLNKQQQATTDTLKQQDEKAAKQEVKIDTIAKQTDGLLQKFGDVNLVRGKLEGAEQERQRAVEIDAAVIVATSNSGGLFQPPEPETTPTPIPVVVANTSPVPVTQTKRPV